MDGKIKILLGSALNIFGYFIFIFTGIYAYFFNGNIVTFTITISLVCLAFSIFRFGEKLNPNAGSIVGKIFKQKWMQGVWGELFVCVLLFIAVFCFLQFANWVSG